MPFRLLSIPAAALVFFAVAAVEAQTDSAPYTNAQRETADRLIDRALEDDTAWDILESLTTEVGPRLAGSEAEARARDWAARKMKALDFKNVRIETFELPYWSRTRESAEIVAPFAQPLAVAALGGSVATPEGGVEGEIARFETLQDLIDAPMEGLEGKIVFVDEIMTRTQDGSGYGAAVAKRSGAAREAGRRGAAAALIRSVGTDSHRLPHTGMMRYAEGMTPVPAAALSNPDADQLARALRLADGPVRVRLDIGVETRERAISGNVIGEIPGRTDEIIVIGGHLDSWDLGTGAVDDGAGVAVTMAAAKLIDDLTGKPKRTIRVVLWGAEEVGLVGARAYAEAHESELDRHVLASESDFGAGRVWRFQSRFGEAALPKAAAIARVLRRLGVGPGDNNAFGGPDVGPLRAAGVPVFTLAQDGWDYFDLHHTADDTLDKVEPEALKQNVAAWAATVYLASEMEGGFRDHATEGSAAGASR
ncbi:M20/M25/M40 family metallo-hydrolase [Amphiplicatus metriothermophilus]|uniref:Carboxypeptidase Q n=1 Tax=Amphiplicatus metriothermophilus TaxID=1519374 RepID=A0A239PJT5_9PROT|nr:M20/M25/M40 family metallo-hydrolase [Amphiplicatus metriothermophilus]MBB5517821.1 Zn-dependent M28 family amino/carboxypeptidase [Amphiplicatus metriothermophilus]SNT67845.1 Zn-dependent amino- or carboxypeptidase, M28 family [Amphiplicatus metriothermophilus]